MQRDTDSDGTPEDYFYLGDDLHNVMAIVDSTGTVIERYEYGDYGQPVNPDPQSPDYLKGIAGPTQTGSNPSTINNPYLFNSRRFDPETGLYWYRTRYLDPIAGRFTSRDTIGIWGDPAEFGNGNAYVGNNPWTFLDPFGLQKWEEQPQPGKGADKAEKAEKQLSPCEAAQEIFDGIRRVRKLTRQLEQEKRRQRKMTKEGNSSATCNESGR